MNKLNRILLMLIAMTAIMIVAAGIDKGRNLYSQKKLIRERETIYEESRADIAKMRETIQSLSEDTEALLSYLEENELSDAEGMLLEEAALGEALTGNEPTAEIAEETILEKGASEDTLSGNSVSENSASEDTLSENSVSGNDFLTDTVSGNSAEQREPVASYEATIRQNHTDKEIIAANTVDFSEKKIACLGDSITAAANLDSLENYLQLSYPAQLQEILNAKEVVNLGIGGSSIGRYWENAFVDRYRDIPEDSDIIIVMGGTNDGFCASETELGSLEERAANTFAGDLDELLRGLKENYPEAEIVLVTPPANILHDLLRKDREYLLPQSSFVKIMKQLALEYDIPVIDLYYSNLLNTHDAAVIHSFMPDGVHCNEMGYRILAEHIAAELIQLQTENE